MNNVVIRLLGPFNESKPDFVPLPCQKKVNISEIRCFFGSKTKPEAVGAKRADFYYLRTEIRTYGRTDGQNNLLSDQK